MHADLPTGVVTLLFTDIEGSTRLLTDVRTDGHRWGRTIAASRIAFAYLGMQQPEDALRWAIDSLGRDDDRLGRLYALSAVAAAHIRSGDVDERLPVLRQTVAEAGTPAAAPDHSVDARPPDLDAIIVDVTGASSPS